MSSQPLYLKYRPSKLSELVGQDLLVQTLTNSINNNKLGHAYLLTGPRGCGKTSTARIIAKSLNCLEGQSHTPCGVCINCLEISKSSSLDVIEIDAASHRSVEDATDLIDKIHYPPQTGKYKIYILDEVHMLSNHAFNALLKVIEEPPANVIFIFATTEEHKVLPTIISRCQRFSIRPIEIKDIVKRLDYVSRQENINISPEALNKLAKLSKGGMRDALSLLDQVSVLSATENTIEESTINQLFGTISDDLLDQLLNNLLEGDSHAVLEDINYILELGKDNIQIIRNLTEYSINNLETNIKSKNAEIFNKLIILIDYLFELENELRSNTCSDIKFKAKILQVCHKDFYNLHKDIIPAQAQVISQAPAPQLKTKPIVNNISSVPAASVTVQPTSVPEPVITPSVNNSPIGDLINAVSSVPLKSLLKQSEIFLISQTDTQIELGLAPEKEKGFLARLEGKSKLLQEAWNKSINIIITENTEEANNTQKKKPEIVSSSTAQEKEEKKEIIKETPIIENNIIQESSSELEPETNTNLSPSNSEDILSAMMEHLGATIIEK